MLWYIGSLYHILLFLPDRRLDLITWTSSAHQVPFVGFDLISFAFLRLISKISHVSDETNVNANLNASENNGSKLPPKRSCALVPILGQEGAPRAGDAHKFSLVKFARSAVSTPRDSPGSSPGRPRGMVAEEGHPLETADEASNFEPSETGIENEVLTESALDRIFQRSAGNLRLV